MKNQKMRKAPIVFGTVLGLAALSGTLFTFANNNTSISLEQAKAIALQDAQMTAEQVTFVKEKKGSDDGRAVYDIEFYNGTQEFDYEIDVHSGAITEKDFDIDDFNAALKSSKGQNAPTKKTFISEEEAKHIAVSDAGVNAAEVTFLTVKLDTDDDRDEYDIEFYVGGTEYDYEIDAITGAINERDRDIEGYDVSTQGGTARYDDDRYDDDYDDRYDDDRYGDDYDDRYDDDRHDDDYDDRYDDDYDDQYDDDDRR